MIHPTPATLSRRATAVASCIVAALCLATTSAHAGKPAANQPPVISGTPSTSATVGVPYAFQPSATDPEGRPISFRIANKPAWATFSTSTGLLRGTPPAGGPTSTITISASDGKKSAALPGFVIDVTAPVVNRAPTIGGTPVTVAEADRPYSFQPAASDADGDALSFGIANKPVWATFDATTGTLYGTPTGAEAGTYGNVTISVSDGKLSTALSPFAITVAPAPTRSVTLQWTAPTSNTDGTALTDLAGYTVAYGNASRQYQTTVRLPDAGATSLVLEGLAPGTWYFSIRSFNNTGLESDYSGEVSANL
jgi:hypothetical protein